MKLVWEGNVTLDGTGSGRYSTYIGKPETYFNTGGGRYFVVRVEWDAVGDGADAAGTSFDIEQTASLRDDGLGWTSLFNGTGISRRMVRGSSLTTFVVTGIAVANFFNDVQSLWRFVITNAGVGAAWTAIRFRVWITAKDA